MADISSELNCISKERYGEDMRAALHDALEKINHELEEKKRGAPSDG